MNTSEIHSVNIVELQRVETEGMVCTNSVISSLPAISKQLQRENKGYLATATCWQR